MLDIFVLKLGDNNVADASSSHHKNNIDSSTISVSHNCTDNTITVSSLPSSSAAAAAATCNTGSIKQSPPSVCNTTSAADQVIPPSSSSAAGGTVSELSEPSSKRNNLKMFRRAFRRHNGPSSDAGNINEVAKQKHRKVHSLISSPRTAKENKGFLSTLDEAANVVATHTCSSNTVATTMNSETDSLVLGDDITLDIVDDFDTSLDSPDNKGSNSSNNIHQQQQHYQFHDSPAESSRTFVINTSAISNSVINPDGSKDCHGNRPATFVLVYNNNSNSKSNNDENAYALQLQHPDTLVDAVYLWKIAMARLVASPEFRQVWYSSRDIVVCLGNSVWHLVMQPVLLPLNLCYHTTNFVAQNAIKSAQLLTTVGNVQNNYNKDSDKCDTLCTTTKNNHFINPLHLIVQSVTFVPNLVLGAAGSLTGSVGSVITGVIMPHSSSDKKDSKDKLGKSLEASQNKDFLDKLRLDYIPKEYRDMESNDNNCTKSVDNNKDADVRGSKYVHFVKSHEKKTSPYLLRVCDIDVNTPEGVKVCYIDLQECLKKDETNSLSKDLIETALENLAHTGLALFANHPTARIATPVKTKLEHDIVWKSEGNTGALVRQLKNMSPIERLALLEKELLVWSGKFKVEQGYGRQAPFYLARGMVRKSPREMMELLWDNERTDEYNKYCEGRRTVLDLDDKVLTGKTSTGYKVIESITRVPFTGMTVKAHCLMYVRPLPEPDTGYIIASRTCDTGSAGVHYEKTSTAASKHWLQQQQIEQSKSEILWGINIMRSVPQNPNLTDLISMSQVGSSLVPKFIAGKIARAGLQEFIGNVRRGHV